MSRVRTVAKFAAAAAAFALGFKLALPPKVAEPPKRVPAAASDVFKDVAPAKKTVVAVAPHIAKAATAYAKYADLFGYTADGQPASGLAALQQAVSDLKKNKLFKPEALDAALQRLERAARDVKTPSAGTLSQYSTADLVASLKDGGKAHAFYLAIQNLSYTLHTGGQVQTVDLAKARAAFIKYSKGKTPIIANLEKAVSMTFMHYNFARANLSYSQSDYDANVRELEPALAGIFEAQPAAALKVGKDTKAPVILTVSEFATPEANTLSKLILNNTLVTELDAYRSAVGITGPASDRAELEEALKAYRAAPKDGALFRKAALAARSSMLFATSHPKYEAYAKSHKGAALKNLETAVDAYFKVEPPIRTRCGQGVRGYGCG